MPTCMYIPIISFIYTCIIDQPSSCPYYNLTKNFKMVLNNLEVSF